MQKYKVEKKKPALPSPVSQVEIVKLKADAVKLAPSAVMQQAAGLVVHDPDSYALADSYLSSINIGEEKVKQRFYGEDGKSGPIPSIRSGLDQLYAIVREITKPMEDTRKIIVGKMKVYKLEEKRKIDEAKRLQEEEQARLRREADEKQAKIATARTAPMREKLAQQAADLNEQADAVAENTPQGVRVVGSSSRFTVKVRLKEEATAMRKLVEAVSSGKIPLDVLEVNQRVLTQYLKDDPATVKSWDEDGIEVYEDATIVGRAG